MTTRLYTLLCGLVAALVVAGASYAMNQDGFRIRAWPWKTVADGQLQISNAAQTSNLIIQTDTSNKEIRGKQLTTDVNGQALSIGPENLWPGAAAAKTPGALALRGGLDSKTLVFDQANPDTGGSCPGTTIQLVVCTAAGCTTNTYTYNTYCSGGCTTQAAACTALAAAVEASAGVGATCGAQTGGSASTVLVTADAGTIYVEWLNETAACTTFSNGTDGGVAIGGMLAKASSSGNVTSLTTLSGGGLAITVYSLTGSSGLAGGFVTSHSYLQIDTATVLPACAAAGDVGKLTRLTKANASYFCLCTQTGAATYAWTGIPVTADCS